MKRKDLAARCAAGRGKEMSDMARVAHISTGFERERDDKDGKREIEHGKKDLREDRADDSRDE